MAKITVVVPCYNEQQSLQQFYTATQEVFQSLPEHHFTYFFVNDGSSDDSLNILRALAEKDIDVNYISFSRNFGKEAALIAGLDFADGEAVITMDADLQHPPELIPEMLKYWQEGYDDVCAKRADRKAEGFIKRHLTNLFYTCMGKFSKLKMQRNVGDFRLLDKRCVEALRLLREEQRYTKGLFTWVGYKKKEIPYQVQPRAGGATSWNYISLYNFAMDGLTSFSTVPLKLTTVFGFLVSLVAIIYMLFVVFKALVFGDPVAGYPTLLTVILFLGGVQMLSLGIIGEYLGRVFNESKHRPLYLVSECNGKQVTYNRQAEPLEKLLK